MITKKALQRSLFFATLAVCLYFIFFGHQGVLKYYQLAKENDHEKKQLVTLEKKNNQLLDKIAQWKQNDFNKEKFVRQELQMAKPNEMVFVTTHT